MTFDEVIELTGLRPLELERLVVGGDIPYRLVKTDARVHDVIFDRDTVARWAEETPLLRHRREDRRQRDEKSKLSHLYAIRAEVTGLVKIGQSVDVPRRFIDLQNASPDRLCVLGVAEAQGFRERYLHKILHEHRLHGEWFSAHVTKGIEQATNFATWVAETIRVYEEPVLEGLRQRGVPI